MSRTNLQLEYLAIAKLLPALAKNEQRFALPEILELEKQTALLYCKEDEIPLPSWIEKTESPDFLLTLPNSDKIGIEVTLAVEQAMMIAEKSGDLPNCFSPPPLDNPNPSKREIREDAKSFIQGAKESPTRGAYGRDINHSNHIYAKKLCVPIKKKLKKAEKYRPCSETWLIIHDCTSELGSCPYTELISFFLDEAEQGCIEPFNAFEKVIILKDKEALMFEKSWENHTILPIS